MSRREEIASAIARLKEAPPIPEPYNPPADMQTVVALLIAINATLKRIEGCLHVIEG
jgi:hypothetical protein